MDTPLLELHWLAPDSPADSFPEPATALLDPNGLLAAGGDLSVARLLCAYRHGIFPWYCEGQPILWWSPDPRAVLFPEQLRVSHSLRKQLRQRKYIIQLDMSFDAVVAACAAPRRGQTRAGTWITPAMQSAYAELHRLGYAHSIEVHMNGVLAGGLYGVALGGVFFGESMFSRYSNTSKIALVCLVRQLQAWGFGMLDCQIFSKHLERLGCVTISRREFLRRLEHYVSFPHKAGPWHFNISPEF